MKTGTDLVRRAAIGLAVLLLAAPVASAKKHQKPVELPDWLVLDAEYRLQTVYINPLDLNGTEVTETSWTEQRLQLDLGLRWPKIGGIYVKAHVLNGVLFGDNGTFGETVSPNSGLAVATKRPNNAGWRVGLAEGGDPLSLDGYGPVLRNVEPFQIVHAWGEVNLPFGVLRVGRQPMAEGANIAAHDGSTVNRWGVSRYPDVADRVLFATKLDALVETIAKGKHAKIDTSVENGVILAGAFDWKVIDDVHDTVDDAFQMNVLLSWRKKEANWLGVKWRDFKLQTIMVHNFNEEFDTALWAFPTRFTTHIGPAFIDLQLSIVFGESREISEGLAKLSGKNASTQDLLQVGFHGLFEYRIGPVTLGMQVDYATGDADPRSNTALTQFSFARDFNVGLLMFEHLMAFQTARSAAVGIENLAKLGATSFPLTEVASDGRFQNAIAIFPQIKVDILEGPKNWLHARFGALLAWPEDGVVDPVVTILNEDGLEIEDDAVNFHGGDPGSFYGYEFDLQVEWTYAGFFTWTIEPAVFVPGDAVQDINGDAVASFMFENRFMFRF